MQKFIVIFILSLGLFSATSTFATWQVAGAKTPKTQHPSKYANQSYFLKTQKGNLVDNIRAFAEQYGWKIDWQAPENYVVLMESTLSGSSFEGALQQLLDHYPLKARYDHNARTIAILPIKNKTAKNHRKFYK